MEQGVSLSTLPATCCALDCISTRSGVALPLRSIQNGRLGADLLVRLHQLSSSLLNYQRRAAFPLTIATLLIVPAVLLDGSSSPAWQRVGLTVNWVTWLVLLAHVLIVLTLAGVRSGARLVWVDALLVALTAPFAPPVLQVGRLVRVVRVLRLGVALAATFRQARSIFQHRQFHIVALVALIAVIIGAFGIYSVEFDANPNIRSLGGMRCGGRL